MFRQNQVCRRKNLFVKNKLFACKLMVLTCSNSLRYMLWYLSAYTYLPSLHHTPKRCIATNLAHRLPQRGGNPDAPSPPMHHFGVRFARASVKNNYSDLNNNTRNGLRINDIFGHRTLPLLRRVRKLIPFTQFGASSWPKKTRLPHAYRRATSFFWPLLFLHSCVIQRSYISPIE